MGARLVGGAGGRRPGARDGGRAAGAGTTKPTGLLAGAIVATNFGYFSIGRMALPDLPLTFCITLAIWAALVSTLEQERSPRKFVILAALGLGLGFLMKGPVGLIIPAIVILPVLMIERRSIGLEPGRHRARVPRDARRRDAVVRADVDAPRQRVSAKLLRRRQLRALRDRSLQRSAPVVVLPAGGRRRACCRGRRSRWCGSGRSRSSCAAAAPSARSICGCCCGRCCRWSFYSLSVGKQPRYVLPVLPPLALLLASSIVERTQEWRGFDGVRSMPRRAAAGRARVAAERRCSSSRSAVLLYRAQPLLINVQSIYTTIAASRSRSWARS